jgi:tRNA(Arg) A34 adenosine deaminase TadA
MFMIMDHKKFLQRAIEVAQISRQNGNHPFGALLVSQRGEILLEAQNSVVTERDVTGHAETNLVREASKKFSPAVLAAATLYTSTEPCAMCSGAIYWSGISRVVFALSEEGLLQLTGSNEENPTMHLPCREVLSRGQRPIEVIGPMLEDEAKRVHEGFWQ